MKRLIEICLRNLEQDFIIEPFTGRKIIYEQLLRYSANIANELVEKGIKKGDRAILCFSNEIEFALSHFALLRIGAIAIPIKNSLNVEEICCFIRQVTPKAILSKHDFKEGMLEDVQFAHTVNYDYISNEDSQEDICNNIDYQDDDSIAILYTTGTTGNSKGVVLKYSAVISDFQEYGSELNFNKETRFIQSMPVWHSDGWNFTFLLPLMFGSSVLLTNPFDIKVASQFDELLNEWGGNVFLAVPEMLSILLEIKFRYKKNVKGILEAVLCGSSKLYENIRKRFENEFGTKILENYGLTETLLIAYYNYNMKYKKNSVGKISKQCEVKIEEDGEILVHSPFLFKEYYANKSSTVLAYDGYWFHTGDLGYIDEEYYLYLIGRKRDIINKAGKKIDPEEINLYILKNKNVKDVATIGVRDLLVGEEIYIFIVPMEANIDLDEFMNNFRKEFTQEKWPKKLLVIDKIPRNDIGKVDKQALNKCIENK